MRSSRRQLDRILVAFWVQRRPAPYVVSEIMLSDNLEDFALFGLLDKCLALQHETWCSTKSAPRESTGDADVLSQASADIHLRLRRRRYRPSDAGRLGSIARLHVAQFSASCRTGFRRLSAHGSHDRHMNTSMQSAFVNVNFHMCSMHETARICAGKMCGPLTSAMSHLSMDSFLVLTNP